MFFDKQIRHFYEHTFWRLLVGQQVDRPVTEQPSSEFDLVRAQAQVGRLDDAQVSRAAALSRQAQILFLQ
jgi:hypothetical protein